MASRNSVLSGLCLLVLILSGVLPTAFTLAGGALVGSVPGAVAGGFESAAGERLILALAATVGLFILQQGIGSVGSTMAYGLGERLTGHLKRRVMRVVLSPPGVAHLEDPDVMSKIAAAQSVGTGQYTPRHAVIALLVVWGPRLSAIGSAILLATFRWWLALGLLAGWIALYWLIFDTFRRLIGSMMNEGDTMRRANYIASLGLTAGASKETRVFGLS